MKQSWVCSPQIIVSLTRTGLTVVCWPCERKANLQIYRRVGTNFKFKSCIPFGSVCFKKKVSYRHGKVSFGIPCWLKLVDNVLQNRSKTFRVNNFSYFEFAICFLPQPTETYIFKLSIFNSLHCNYTLQFLLNI